MRAALATPRKDPSYVPPKAQALMPTFSADHVEGGESERDGASGALAGVAEGGDDEEDDDEEDDGNNDGEDGDDDDGDDDWFVQVCGGHH